jgi:anti-sigma regulatory factor (Ser/Thr protein kinase)
MTFTAALLIISGFIYFSDKNNNTNKWFAYCYLIASLGTLKEFMMDSVVPLLVAAYPGIGLETYVMTNSCVTAFLYLFSPFCFITLSMVFSDMDKMNRKVFAAVQIATAVIICVCLFIYSPMDFKYYQLNRKDFWYVMTSFNVGYAIIGSVIMFINIRRETVYEIKRRKRITLEILLLPYYYCMIAIYIVHLLDIESLKKVWKGNIYLVVAVLAFYCFIAYKEGFMGLKISFVRYDWNSEMHSVNTSTQYINHMLKNHVTKIIWSIDNIRAKLGNEEIEEIDIIERSVKQIRAFTEKTNKCLSPKMAGDDICCASNLIFEALESAKKNKANQVAYSVEAMDDVLLVCDAQNIVEVLYNIIINGIEATTNNGEIRVSTYFKKKSFCIEVSDNGTGISEEQLKQIFKPFYTTKKNNVNFGIGLSYCKNVIQAHNGDIDVYSEKNKGTRVVLWFPLKRVRRKERISVGQ